jgi:hypothetical protein
MKTIPQIRARMHELADILKCKELHELADATKRRKPVRRAPPVHAVVTTKLAQEVRDYAARYPSAHLSEIGLKFDLNQGRVSEILAGKR